MALPKNRKPLVARTNRSQIEEAVRIAGTMQTPGVSPEEGAARRPERAAAATAAPRIAQSPPPAAPPSSQPAAPVPQTAPVLPLSSTPQPAKRIGRPPLKEDRTERLNAVVSESTRDRLRTAMYGESIHTKGKIDQSLIIEDAITAWLDQRGY